MTMSGNISGMDSLDMVLQAGSLGVDGVIDVNSLTTQADSVLTLFIDNDVKTRSVVVANTINIGGTLNYTFSESLYGLKQGDIISVLNAADRLTLSNEHQTSYSLEAILDYYIFEYVFDDNMSGWKVISAKSKQKGTQSSSIMMTSVINAVGNKVTGRLGAISTPVFGVKGKSGGNTFEETGIWGKALYTHAHKSGTNGFKADAIGGVIGLDGKPAQHLTAGLALSYSRTDGDTKESNADIDTYAAFLYGKYEQTEKLSYSAVVGYGLSQFKMSDSLDFDAHFANIQGYVDYVLGKGFVLQGGARYVYAHQEKYNVGNTTYKTNDTDTLTAVLGGSYNYAQSRWFAQARLTAIYDLVSDKGDFKAIASGMSLYMDGERLHRFGAEAGVTAGFRTNKWSFELGYDAQIRKDYNDQTLSLKAGYQF